MKEWISIAPQQKRRRKGRGLSTKGLFCLLVWAVLVIGGAGAWRREA